MLDISATNIQRLCITFVGNKGRYEGVSVPKTTLVPVHDYAHEVLISGFLKPFEKSEEFFYFHHEEDVSQNQVYQSCMGIFADPASLPAEAAKLTQNLYDTMLTPKANGGELLVAYFDELLLDGEPTAGIGIFKIQSKDNYLKVERTAEAFTLNVLEGIPTGKLEVAALIFNLDEANGYRICCVDSITKPSERSFWKDDFLRVRPVEDNYFQTRHHVALAAQFIRERGVSVLGLNAAQQAEMLNRAAEYFTENEYFELDDFMQHFLPAKADPKAFEEFWAAYGNAYAVPLEHQFGIAAQAVKKEGKHLKRVLKLDRNFKLEVKTGRADLIERGYDDDRGKNYYKIYFDDEQ